MSSPALGNGLPPSYKASKLVEGQNPSSIAALSSNDYYSLQHDYSGHKRPYTDKYGVLNRLEYFSSLDSSSSASQSARLISPAAAGFGDLPQPQAASTPSSRPNSASPKPTSTPPASQKTPTNAPRAEQVSKNPTASPLAAQKVPPATTPPKTALPLPGTAEKPSPASNGAATLSKANTPVANGHAKTPAATPKTTSAVVTATSAPSKATPAPAASAPKVVVPANTAQSAPKKTSASPLATPTTSSPTPAAVKKVASDVAPKITSATSVSASPKPSQSATPATPIPAAPVAPLVPTTQPTKPTTNNAEAPKKVTTQTPPIAANSTAMQVDAPPATPVPAAVIAPTASINTSTAPNGSSTPNAPTLPTSSATVAPDSATTSNGSTQQALASPAAVASIPASIPIALTAPTVAASTVAAPARPVAPSAAPAAPAAPAATFNGSMSLEALLSGRPVRVSPEQLPSTPGGVQRCISALRRASLAFYSCPYAQDEAPSPYEQSLNVTGIPPAWFSTFAGAFATVYPLVKVSPSDLSNTHLLVVDPSRPFDWTQYLLMLHGALVVRRAWVEETLSSNAPPVIDPYLVTLKPDPLNGTLPRYSPALLLGNVIVLAEFGYPSLGRIARTPDSTPQTSIIPMDVELRYRISLTLQFLGVTFDTWREAEKPCAHAPHNSILVVLPSPDDLGPQVHNTTRSSTSSAACFAAIWTTDELLTYLSTPSAMPALMPASSATF